MSSPSNLYEEKLEALDESKKITLADMHCVELKEKFEQNYFQSCWHVVAWVAACPQVFQITFGRKKSGVLILSVQFDDLSGNNYEVPL